MKFVGSKKSTLVCSKLLWTTKCSKKDFRKIKFRCFRCSSWFLCRQLKTTCLLIMVLGQLLQFALNVGNLKGEYNIISIEEQSKTLKIGWFEMFREKAFEIRSLFESLKRCLQEFKRDILNGFLQDFPKWFLKEFIKRFPREFLLELLIESLKKLHEKSLKKLMSKSLKELVKESLKQILVKFLKELLEESLQKLLEKC